MRCDGCRHWTEEPEEWEAKAVGFRECRAVRERWRIQDDASSGIEWAGEEDGAYMQARRDALKAARAYVQDGSEYMAQLYTAPDFFCALWAAKG